MSRLAFRGEAALLNEALSNLLHNAIRHAGEGSHVTLALAADEARLRVSVTDDGPGMPPEELQRAGERFFRGGGQKLPGSGLGLSIARSVAQRHGGSLRVMPGPEGRGLCVELALPIDFKG